jgi:hypothetical protein
MHPKRVFLSTTTASLSLQENGEGSLTLMPGALNANKLKRKSEKLQTKRKTLSIYKRSYGGLTYAGVLE